MLRRAPFPFGSEPLLPQAAGKYCRHRDSPHLSSLPPQLLLESRSGWIASPIAIVAPKDYGLNTFCFISTCGLQEGQGVSKYLHLRRLQTSLLRLRLRQHLALRSG